jgi:F-type H+-transporting ATPase subunit b
MLPAGPAVLSAPEAIAVDFDGTFLVPLVLFVVLTLALKPLLFDPMLKLFEEREKLIDGAKAQARRIDEKSANAEAIYETEMNKARASGNAERETVRAQAVKREQEILAQARQNAAQAIEAGKRAAQGEADRARRTLQGGAGTLADDLASRVLGRKVSP